MKPTIQVFFTRLGCVRVCRFLGIAALVGILTNCTNTSTTDGGAVRQTSARVEEVIVTAQKSARPHSPEPLSIVQVPAQRDIYIDNNERSYQIFRDYGVNPTIQARAKPDSTFAMDVDNGSYRLAAAMLAQGQLPDPASIRVEEFVNAITYQYQSNAELFALSAEAMPSPFRRGYHVLHLGVQAKAVADEERLPANLVLVADVSGSMESDNKLELLKQAFMTLTAQLSKNDRVALVAYSDSAKLVLRPTAGDKKRKIFAAIDSLRSGGSTNASEGIMLGYKTAASMFQPGIINRVILTSDGMANVGATSPEAILRQIRQQKDKGVFLTTVGVGIGVYNDWLLEQLADQGNGRYLYVGNAEDIQSAFVDRLTGQLQTVAKNAKVQVMFNPEVVSHYRLLGYENRHLNKEDFLDTSKDGGEIGSGHRVTAIYEIKLAPEAEGKNLADFAIAYQKTGGSEIHQLSKAIPAAVVRENIRAASADMRLSVSAAAFAEKLRMSYWSGAYTYRDVLDLVASLPDSYMQNGQIGALREMIRRAQRYDNRAFPYDLRTSVTTLNLDHVPLLQ